jgi:LysM repeat protein
VYNAHLTPTPAGRARRFALPAAITLIVAALLALAPAMLHAQTGDTQPYTVQAGETLSEIAAAFNIDADTLLALNGLTDPDAIYEGQILLVPAEVPTGLAPAAEPPVESQAEPAATVAIPETHTVQAGETLTGIARRYGIPAATLKTLNGLSDADAIYEGQVLLVAAEVPTAPAPTAEPAAESATESATEPATESAGEPVATFTIPETHTVQAGETLTGIARRYGLPAATLKALNGLSDADFIVVGQELILSVAALPEEPTPTPEPTSEPTPEPTSESTAEPTTAPEATEAAQEPATATPEATPAGTPTAIPDVHTVQPGETLTGIARRYGLTLGALQALNGIDDENAIYVGQELALLAPTPEPTAGPPPEAAEAAPDEVAAEGTAETATPVPTIEAPIVRSGSAAASLNRTYTIVFGDTLSRIALRQGLDADALASLNGFDSVNAPLNAGATLLLPATGDELRPSTPAQEHVVAPGESLSAIAQSYGVDTADLMAANGISDANAIYSGQRLLIPSQPLGGGAVLRQLGPASSGYFFYTVQPGDTLSAIAKQFDSTMEALRTFNGLPDNETVYTGLELKIPFGPPALPLNLPPAPMSGTRFVVSLSRQQCWVFEGDRVRYAWNCSTGQPDRKTKTGNFAVQSKIPNAKSKVWELDMPYWLGIYDVGDVENGIHGLPMAWSSGKKIWSGLIGQPATFGCAMLDDANASTLYRMAFLGMPVHIVN